MRPRIARNAGHGETQNSKWRGLPAIERGLAVVFAGVVVALGACGPVARTPREPSVGGPFSLVNQDGGRVDQQILLGHWTLVFFGYTYCPDVCPTTLTTLGAAMDKLGPAAGGLRVIFITVDPQRDTPAQLKTYLSSPSFPKGTVGLTGSPAEIAAAAGAYRVYYRKAEEGPGYSVDHTSVVYLMDPQGHFARPLGFGASPADVARQIGDAMRGA